MSVLRKPLHLFSLIPCKLRMQLASKAARKTAPSLNPPRTSIDEVEKSEGGGEEQERENERRKKVCIYCGNFPDPDEFWCCTEMMKAQER